MFKFLMAFLVALISIAANYRVTQSNEVQGIFNLQNLIANASDEKVSSSWTTLGGVVTTTTIASTIGRGEKSFAYNASATNQIVSTRQITIPKGLYGQRALLSCLVFAPNSAQFRMEAINGSFSIVSTMQIVSSTTYVRQNLEFTMPSSGTVGAQLRNLSGDAPQIFFDDCYLGEAMHKVSPVRAFSAYHDNTCAFTNANTSWADYTSDATCGFTERLNNNMGTVNSMFSGAERNAGITINFQETGLYYVCASFKLVGGASIRASHRLVVEGASGVTSLYETDQNTDTNGYQTNLCAIYNANELGVKKIKLQADVSGNTATISATTDQVSSIEWMGFKL